MIKMMSMVIGYHDDHDHEDVDNHNHHDLSGRSSHLVHPVSSLFPRGQVPRHKTVAVTADDGDDDDDGVDDDDDDDDNDDDDDDIPGVPSNPERKCPKPGRAPP